MTARLLKFIIRLIFISLTLMACSHQQEEQQFYYQPLQWRIAIPAGYVDISVERRQKIERRGQEGMQDAFGQPVPVLSTYILGVENGRTNLMIALLNPYDPQIDGDYHAMQKLTFDALELAYKHRQLNFKAARKRNQVGGHEFYCQHISMFPRPEIIIEQTTCDALIKGQSFSFSMTCDRAEECTRQRSAWLQSSFGKHPKN